MLIISFFSYLKKKYCVLLLIRAVEIKVLRLRSGLKRRKGNWFINEPCHCVKFPHFYGGKSNSEQNV